MYNNKKGWYLVKNPDKFIKPLDEHMKSYNKDNNGTRIKYRSGIELKAFIYADNNDSVIKFSIEPFHVKYLKPTDGKIHRYFIDMFLEFNTGDKFIVEVKSSSETKPPRRPKKMTTNTIKNYKRACNTYSVNLAKWNAAKEFALQNGFRFIILTEKELS